MLKKLSKQFLIASLILIGTLIWSIIMIRSGLNYSYGLGFWGPNGHDGIWHIALTENLSVGSFENPVFAGETVKNYHLGFDLLLALINKLTNIPISYLYFQILPPLFAITIGLLVYKLVYIWRDSKFEALIATLFVFLGSGFGFIVTFIKDGLIAGESMFWSQQSISTLVNPPFALSLIFILAGLIALQKKKLYIAILFFGLLIQIKAYSAILVLGGLFATGIYSFYILNSKFYLQVFAGSLLLNLILFFVVKNDGLSAFIWQPFWFLETMMSYSDRLGWERFYSAMTTYKMGHIWIKGLLAYSVAFIIFLIGNVGTRIIGLLYFLKVVQGKIKIDNLFVFLISVCVMALLIPMFFVQNGTPWNTIQFFYYFLFIMSIFAGIATTWLNKKFYVVLAVLTIFGAWTTLQHYLPPMPQSFVSTTELEALNFLKAQPKGIVLTYPFDQYKSKEAKFSPRPLYLYESTAYVSAFSQKPVFMEDEVNLNIMGYDWKSRRSEILQFISNLDPIVGREFLDKNKIKYLYLVKENSPLQGELLKLGSADLSLEKIFDNKEYIIYRYGENFGNN